MGSCLGRDLPQLRAVSVAARVSFSTRTPASACNGLRGHLVPRAARLLGSGLLLRFPFFFSFLFCYFWICFVVSFSLEQGRPSLHSYEWAEEGGSGWREPGQPIACPSCRRCSLLPGARARTTLLPLAPRLPTLSRVAETAERRMEGRTERRMEGRIEGGAGWAATHSWPLRGPDPAADPSAGVPCSSPCSSSCCARSLPSPPAHPSAPAPQKRDFREPVDVP